MLYIWFMEVNLHEIAIEIREILNQKRLKNNLYFVEDDHKYFINNENGESISNLPSVSTIVHRYYEEFPKEEKALSKANGDVKEQKRLLEEWARSGDVATSIGSRTHYLLEKYLLSLYDDYKEVRKPLFNCDLDMCEKSNGMVLAGVKYIDFLHKNGCVLLDTEMVLGDLDLGYFGQPDKVWLVITKKGKIALLISDWKTNKEEKFKIQKFTKKMYNPFEFLPDNSLGHYSLQLPLYGRLICKMLEGTKYSNIKVIKHSIVNVKSNGDYDVYDVDKKVVEEIYKLKI